MAVMKIFEENGNLILVQDDFTLFDTFECGQTFRWDKVSEDTYHGYVLDRELTVSQSGNKFILHNVCLEDTDFWADYFDLDTDYGEVKRQLSADPVMAKACEFGGGIRILKQNSYEMLISFIISQNNNIPRIKKNINDLCGYYGHFPTSRELSETAENELDFIKLGYRAPYIINAAKMVQNGELDLDKIKHAPIAGARKSLLNVLGIGAKVCDCVLLFGLNRLDAFPVDTWIRRALADCYPQGLPDTVMKYPGIAQQYLFHYRRNGY
ncbi:MAG: DNA-3-methyladenine glycosylase 2 family protein [Oscillospiraceae bacterium]|jgi:N-glycosylase/DNA lyase|nr:DNA-3-methyladenine glycosylase 2 family protein [Oscillospiraceae bacterium]